MFLAAGLFALGILVIVGNTIRLDIENRRGEIEVTKLVGGSDAFVRRPFLYNGVWYGLGGGADRLADRRHRRRWCSSDPVQRIAGLYGSEFALHGLGAERQPRAGRAAASLLGWLGSFIVATRELRGIEPK